MIKNEIGRVKKDNVTLIEYETGSFFDDDKVFIQVGVVGLFCTKKELDNLQTVINYYSNVDSFTECKVMIEGKEHGWMAI